MKTRIVKPYPPLPKGKRQIIKENIPRGDGCVTQNDELDISFEGDHILVTTFTSHKVKYTVDVPNPICRTCQIQMRDDGPWFRCMRKISWIGIGKRRREYSLCSFHANEMKSDPRIIRMKRIGG